MHKKVQTCWISFYYHHRPVEVNRIQTELEKKKTNHVKIKWRTCNVISETERLISIRTLTVQRRNYNQFWIVFTSYHLANYTANEFDTCSSSPVIVFRWWSELASGVSSSLGGTSCQNIPRYLSHSSTIAAPLLLPVFSCFLFYIETVRRLKPKSSD